jgi:hypothetical protein
VLAIINPGDRIGVRITTSTLTRPAMHYGTKELKTFLQFMNDYHKTINHRGLPALVLEGGSWFRGRASSNAYDSARRWKKSNVPKIKDCFYNAQTFCLDHDEARYFEGYALFRPRFGPDLHSWVVMPDGNVVDFTFEAVEQFAKRKLLSVRAGESLYAGVEVPTGFIRKWVSTSGWFDSLAEEYFAS